MSYQQYEKLLVTFPADCSAHAPVLPTLVQGGPGMWVGPIWTGLNRSRLPRKNSDRPGLAQFRPGQSGLQTLIHHSFSHNGVRLFNCAPRHIRDLTGVTTDTFKHHLDKWLADIPDQPPTPGYSSSHDNTLPSVVLEARNRELHTTPGMSGGPPQLRR
ncbi:hypothetical protein GWK47_009852 [Chionoecetes opilio]|uniref:Uncharacterized protein n=1 Tax=Chionoecetes opilio TaxID=41210 RepID=A0A8J4XYB7_CHIOP|nr:hypothetical protein GWK47_009852 [Chionoecetes opilio]